MDYHSVYSICLCENMNKVLFALHNDCKNAIYHDQKKLCITMISSWKIFQNSIRTNPEAHIALQNQQIRNYCGSPFTRTSRCVLFLSIHYEVLGPDWMDLMFFKVCIFHVCI